jgi:DHA2 family methylenomycin A resistance protein-like MFS transporter
VALVGITIAAVEAGRSGLGSAVVAGVVGLVAAAVFVLIERHATAPMIPRAMLADRALVTPVGIGSLMNFGFYGQLFVITLYLQQVRHLSPLLTGIALLPQTGVIAVSSWAGGRVTGRIGPRLPMAVGMGIGAAGFLTLTIATRSIPYAWLIVPMAAAGFGIAFTMPAATTGVIDVAPAERAGLASGLLNTGRQVGGALGIAVLGTLYAAATFPTGFRLAMIVAGCAYLGGLALAVSLPAREPVTATARG